MNKKSILTLLVLLVGASFNAQSAVIAPNASAAVSDAFLKSQIIATYAGMTYLAAMIAISIIWIKIEYNKYADNKANQEKDAELKKIRNEVAIKKAEAAKLATDKAFAESDYKAVSEVSYY